LQKQLFTHIPLIPSKASIKLLSLRQTEPMLERVLSLTKREPYRQILKHFDASQSKINKSVLKLIKNNDVFLPIAILQMSQMH
jgi:hypothetical protein